MIRFTELPLVDGKINPRTMSIICGRKLHSFITELLRTLRNQHFYQTQLNLNCLINLDAIGFYSMA